MDCTGNFNSSARGLIGSVNNFWKYSLLLLQEEPVVSG